MKNLRLITHPLIGHKVTLMRDVATPTKLFRELVAELAMLLAYEAMRDLATESVTVETPLEKASGVHLSGKHLTIVPVLRAGLGMADGVLRIVPTARVGHVGLARDHVTLEPVQYYLRMPGDLAARDVFVLDPMLATGGSAVDAVNSVKKAGAKRIRLLSLVAAPAGVERMAAAHPDVLIYCAALDRELNAKGYIMPGLGDAGDRLFGTKES